MKANIVIAAIVALTLFCSGVSAVSSAKSTLDRIHAQSRAAMLDNGLPY
jgi:hypothetical protein